MTYKIYEVLPILLKVVLENNLKSEKSLITFSKTPSMFKNSYVLSGGSLKKFWIIHKIWPQVPGKNVLTTLKVVLKMLLNVANIWEVLKKLKKNFSTFVLISLKFNEKVLQSLTRGSRHFFHKKILEKDFKSREILNHFF